MKGIEVLSVEVETSETYVFKLDRGWLNVTICEAKGSIDIQSDWGSAQAMWSAQAGKLKEFLARMDVSYVSRNLGTPTFMGRPMKMKVVDWEGAEKKLKAQVLRLRRERDYLFLEHLPKNKYGLHPDVCFDKETAAAYWEAIDNWCSDPDLSIDAAMYNIPDEVYNLTIGEPWFLLEEKSTPASNFWHEHLLPTVLHFFKEMEEKRMSRVLNGMS